MEWGEGTSSSTAARAAARMRLEPNSILCFHQCVLGGGAEAKDAAGYGVAEGEGACPRHARS